MPETRAAWRRLVRSWLDYRLAVAEYREAKAVLRLAQAERDRARAALRLVLHDAEG